MDALLLGASPNSLSAARSLGRAGLRVVIARGKGAAETVDSQLLKLELVGLDRPGIIRDISRVLAEAKGIFIAPAGNAYEYLERQRAQTTSGERNDE